MRIAILSDIHANIQALQAVLEDIDADDNIDEIWSLGDLIGYGANPEECVEVGREHFTFSLAGNHDFVVTGRAPSATIASLVGPQYYWIKHTHPVALMGYIAVLEGNPPVATAIDRLIERTGFPPEAFRTLTEHSALDAHHFDEFNQALDALPLTPDQSALVGVSAMHTVASIARLFDEIVESVAARPYRRSTSPAADMPGVD